MEISYLLTRGYTNYKRVVREIRTLRAMWRALETELRSLLNGHEEGNLGHSQGGAYGPPRQHSTLPGMTIDELIEQFPVTRE